MDYVFHFNDSLYNSLDAPAEPGLCFDLFENNAEYFLLISALCNLIKKDSLKAIEILSKRLGLMIPLRNAKNNRCHGFKFGAFFYVGLR